MRQKPGCHFVHGPDVDHHVRHVEDDGLAVGDHAAIFTADVPHLALARMKVGS